MNRSYFIIKVKKKKQFLVITRSGGHIDHYYHFIIDFLWPLHEWSYRHNYQFIFESKSKFIALDPKATKFKQILEAVSSVSISKSFLASRIYNRIAFPVKSKIHGFNPNYRDYLKTFKKRSDAQDSLRRFREYIFKKLSVSTSLKTSVLLIERRSEEKSGGALRRHIVNHEELKGQLMSYCVANNITFQNVDLAELDFKTQIELFHNSKIVIGQHGAGLINAIWMLNANSKLIELEGNKQRKHFENFCVDFNIDYCRITGISEISSKNTENLHIQPELVIQEMEKYLKRVN